MNDFDPKKVKAFINKKILPPPFKKVKEEKKTLEKKLASENVARVGDIIKVFTGKRS